jgi:muramoyltetrapeptide carboxypeptidase LdcA involved in peptidoglycan recycling
MSSVSKSQTGDRVAILSPSFAVPGVAPAIHEQALTRLEVSTGLIPVEYPTTRLLGATAAARASDVMDAYIDPSITAILTTIGGSDEITVVPKLDRDVVRTHPKPFLGYSDNTHILNWLWQEGLPAFYGGSTQEHLGAGAGIDDVHLRSLRAALIDGGDLHIEDPGESEDFGLLWNSPEALVNDGRREPTEPWTWFGPAIRVEGRTWGGSIEVIDELALANRLPSNEELAGCILLVETSEELPDAQLVARWLRGLGERGILGSVAGVLVARPAVSSHEHIPSAEERAELRAAQRDAVSGVLSDYNPEAVICIGVPFGHTRPQWILPYGGRITLDGSEREIWANYD